MKCVIVNLNNVYVITKAINLRLHIYFIFNATQQFIQALQKSLVSINLHYKDVNSLQGYELMIIWFNLFKLLYAPQGFYWAAPINYIK